MKKFSKLGKMLSQTQMRNIIGGNEEEEVGDGVVPVYLFRVSYNQLFVRM